MIVGIVYNLAIGNFKQLAKKENTLYLGNLKNYLLEIPFEKSAKLLCLDNCKTCDIFVDTEHYKQIKGFLDDSVRVYKYDFSYGYINVKQEVFFNEDDVEEDVCFSYRIDKSGIGSQILVGFDGKFYDFANYFEFTPVYTSIAQAREAKENLMREVRQ